MIHLFSAWNINFAHVVRNTWKPVSLPWVLTHFKDDVLFNAYFSTLILHFESWIKIIHCLLLCYGDSLESTLARIARDACTACASPAGRADWAAGGTLSARAARSAGAAPLPTRLRSLRSPCCPRKSLFPCCLCCPRRYCCCQSQRFQRFQRFQHCPRCPRCLCFSHRLRCTYGLVSRSAQAVYDTGTARADDSAGVPPLHAMLVMLALPALLVHLAHLISIWPEPPSL